MVTQLLFFLIMGDTTPSVRKPKSSLATLFSSAYHKGSVQISEKYSLIHPRNHEMLTATVPFPIKFRNSVRGKQM